LRWFFSIQKHDFEISGTCRHIYVRSVKCSKNLQIWMEPFWHTILRFRVLICGMKCFQNHQIWSLVINCLNTRDMICLPFSVQSSIY
jgi:hypothetical protein